MYHVKENFNEEVNEIHAHTEIKIKPGDKQRTSPEGRERNMHSVENDKRDAFCQSKNNGLQQSKIEKQNDEL